MAQYWSSSVNQKFYDISCTPKENVQRIEFESGRVKTWLKNSVAKKTFSMSLLLWSKVEEAYFWAWYDTTILSGSLSFYLTDLLDGVGTKEYLFTSPPSRESGSYPKSLTLNVEEV